MQHSITNDKLYCIMQHSITDDKLYCIMQHSVINVIYPDSELSMTLYLELIVKAKLLHLYALLSTASQQVRISPIQEQQNLLYHAVVHHHWQTILYYTIYSPLPIVNNLYHTIVYHQWQTILYHTIVHHEWQTLLYHTVVHHQW